MNELVGQIATAIDYLVGLMLAGGLVLAFVVWIRNLLDSSVMPSDAFRNFRIFLGRVILVSLEVLIVSDILHTLVHRTMNELGMLAVIVVLRCILFFVLEREISALEAEENSG